MDILPIDHARPILKREEIAHGPKNDDCFPLDLEEKCRTVIWHIKVVIESNLLYLIWTKCFWRKCVEWVSRRSEETIKND